MDLYKAGDRMAACKAQMKAVGLTLKRSSNKYAHQKGGELMLIHRCDGCGKVSINRIAADDVAEAILEVFENSLYLDNSSRQQLQRSGIRILNANAYKSVIWQLGGYLAV